MLLRCSTVAMSVVYSYVINVSGNQSRRTQRNVVLRTQLCRQGWHASMADYRQKGSNLFCLSLVIRDIVYSCLVYVKPCIPDCKKCIWETIGAWITEELFSGYNAYGMATFC